MTNTFSRNVRGQTSDLNQGDTREGAGIGDSGWRRTWGHQSQVLMEPIERGKLSWEGRDTCAGATGKKGQAPGTADHCRGSPPQGRADPRRAAAVTSGKWVRRPGWGHVG